MAKVSKAQMAANKKYDSIHFKYQSVKLKAKEYEQLKKTVDLSKRAYECIFENCNNEACR